MLGQPESNLLSTATFEYERVHGDALAIGRTGEQGGEAFREREVMHEVERDSIIKLDYWEGYL